MAPRIMAAVAATLVLMAFPTALAEHAQPLPGAGTITFRDKAGGNEWWVEAIIASSSPVAKVEVMDDGGPWATMAHHPEWGSWTARYHVEPGHRVTFRATTSAGTVTSCPFTHPAGAEQCGSAPPPPGAFDAGFNAVRGNEWWVQSIVTTNGPPIAKVEVTLDGGQSYKSLTKQSWGGWAASLHIVQGTVLQLRATASDGQTDLSLCRKWIPPANQDATIVACGPAPPPPPPPRFTAEFKNVRGNPWWMETDVTASKAIAKVEFREDGGAWVPLQKQSYGSWAISLDFRHQPRVEFRATATTGETDVSYLGYDWAEKPYAVPPTCSHCFEPVQVWQLAGDMRHIKVNTFSVARLLSVSARVGDSGPLLPMQVDADGDWSVTLAQPMPEGSFVYVVSQFKYPGQTVTQTYTAEAGYWPPWPQDGGFVQYAVKYRVPGNGGSYRLWEGTQTWTFHADTDYEHSEGTWRGSWTGRCDLVETAYHAATGQTTTTPRSQESHHGSYAPMGPRFTSVGAHEDVYIGFPVECVSFEVAHLIVQGRGPHATTTNGASYTADAWHGTKDPAWYTGARSQDTYDVYWQRATGIVLDWYRTNAYPDGPVVSEGHVVASNVYGVR